MEEKQQAIIRVMNDGGARLGRRQLIVVLRRQGVLISQYTLSEMMREIDPTGVEGRNFSKRRRRGRMDIAGPGRVWSCDGYDKLKPWGFEIYGFIDGYAQFSLQTYCGIDNKTALLVLVQFLRLVRHLGKLPRLIRGDKGVETPLLA